MAVLIGQMQTATEIEADWVVVVQGRVNKRPAGSVYKQAF
jgi:hypothetical protein